MKDKEHVAVIGGANVDIHGIPHAPLRRGDSNPGRVRSSAGGVARNVAENLSRLNLDTRLISAVGDDISGDFLLRHCRAAGIGVEGVQQSGLLPTATYLSILDSNGELEVAVADMRVVDRLSPADIEPQEPMIEGARLIVVDCNLSADVLEWLFTRFAGQAIYIDTVSETKARRVVPHLSGIHTLKASRAEAVSLSGMPADGEGELRRMSEWFHDRGVGCVCVTLGAAGVFFSDGETRGVRRGALDGASILNTGGAGDAFLSGLVRASTDGQPFRQAVDFGLAVARLTLSDWRACSPDLSMEQVSQAIGDALGR